MLRFQGPKDYSTAGIMLSKPNAVSRQQKFALWFLLTYQLMLAEGEIDCQRKSPVRVIAISCPFPKTSIVFFATKEQARPASSQSTRLWSPQKPSAASFYRREIWQCHVDKTSFAVEKSTTFMSSTYSRRGNVDNNGARDFGLKDLVPNI